MADIAATSLHRRPLLWAIVEMNTPPADALVASCGQPLDHTQMRHRLGRALALHLLAGETPGCWKIETTDRGKPIAVGDAERYISISHTGRMVGAAMSSFGPVGIDIESRKQSRDVVALAAVAFGPAEAADVAANGAAAFYRIWTLREAISKATGEGLPAVVDGVDRIPPQATDGTWDAVRPGWLMAHDVLEGDISLALAVRSRGADDAAAMLHTSIANSRMRLEQ